MATKTQVSQDPQETLPHLATPQARNQVPTLVSAEETATSTMTVAVADATPETVTVTAIAIAEDAAATTTAKRQNQRFPQMTF
jgi:VCBS repeat-containing protein